LLASILVYHAHEYWQQALKPVSCSKRLAAIRTPSSDESPPVRIIT